VAVAPSRAGGLDLCGAASTSGHLRAERSDAAAVARPGPYGAAGQRYGIEPQTPPDAGYRAPNTAEP
jgi:hypothetical protein